MKLLAAGALAGLLLVQDPSPRKPTVSVRVDTLFDAGYSNRWVTLILEVTNQTAEDREFHIYADIGWRDRALRREKLAPKVRKRLFFYLPTAQYSSRVHVRIEDPAGRELLEHEQELALSGGYGRTGGPRLLPALMDRLPVQVPPEFVPKLVKEDHFPDRWIGLDGLSTVLLRDYRFDALLPAQRAALHEWVRRGGEVILYAGNNRDWLTSAGVQELAPIKLGKSEEVESIPALTRFHGPFRERASFAAHEILNGEPLGDGCGRAVRFKNGLGAVTVVPYDLERAPFDSWPATADLRRNLILESQRARPADHSRRSAIPSSARTVSSIHHAATARINRLPPFLLLLGLTLVYLAVVGPVNFLVLRRLKMTVRLVFTIPAISAVFLGIVVLSGYILRGTSTVTFDVCLLETVEDQPLATERHHFSVFAPTPRTYDVAFGDGEIGFPQESEFDENGYYRRRSYEPPSETGVVFDQTDRWTLKDVSLQQWQARAFVGDAIRPIGGGVTFKVDTQLEVTNRTPFAIRKGWALRKDPEFHAIPFGEVPSGETRRFPASDERLRSRNVDWQDIDDLEERLVSTWLYYSMSQPHFDPMLLCALDRLPDEIAINASRSGGSGRLCFLLVESRR